jgi:integrase
MQAARKTSLTDRGLKALKPAEPGKRYVVWDAVQPHLGVRVTEKATEDGKAASVSFIIVRRRPGERNPDTRVLGAYPALSLKDAREKAPGILAEIMGGRRLRDIKAERQRSIGERRRAAEEDTIEAAIAAFVADKRSDDSLRTVNETEAYLRRNFLGQTWERKDGAIVWSDGKYPIWRGRLAKDITRSDVRTRLDAIKRQSGLHAARHSLSAIRNFFNWCGEGRHGIPEGYRLDIRDKTIGAKKDNLRRQRALNDAEIRDVWNAAEAMGYPFGKMVQVLMLTGQRLNDIASAKWGEIDLDNAMLTVPPERYKTKIGQEVPLSDKAIEIIRSLPNYGADSYLFTTTGGRRPISGMSKYKLALSIAQQREEAGAAPMPNWQLHDLRRTVRTRLISDLNVEAFIAERVIGHALAGLHDTYDRGSHRPQKREALDRWAERLLSIVNPAAPEPGNVITMRRKRA